MEHGLVSVLVKGRALLEQYHTFHGIPPKGEEVSLLTEEGLFAVYKVVRVVRYSLRPNAVGAVAEITVEKGVRDE